MPTFARISVTEAELVVLRLGLVNLLWYPFSPRPDLAPEVVSCSEEAIDNLDDCSQVLRTAGGFRGSVIQCERLPSGEVHVHIAAASYLAIVFGLSYVSQKLDDWEFSTLMDVSRASVEELIVRLLMQVAWES